MNFLPGTLRRNGGARRASSSPTARTLAAPRGAGGSDGQPVVLGTRPEHLRLASERRHRRRASSSSSRPAPTPSSPAATAATDMTAVFRERHDFAPGSTIHLMPDLAARAPVRRRQRRAARRLTAVRLPPTDTVHTTGDMTMTDDDLFQPPQVPRKLGRRRRGRDARHRRRAVLARSAQAQTLAFKPEKGAKLRVLRWSRFVQGDIDAYMVNVKKFTEKTGIEVRVDNEGWEDVRPKAAVAANTGAGPDIILSTNDDANLYPDKLLDVTDLRRVPRQEVRRLVPGRRGLPAARRQEVDRRAARRGRLDDGLPREHAEGGRLRQLPEGHRRLPEDVQGAARPRARRAAWRSATPPATACGATGWCGPSAASWSTRTTRS